MTETTTISNKTLVKIGTSCMICGQFVELDTPFISSRPQICNDCKETIQFIKQNRSAIEKFIYDFKKGERR